VVDSGRVQVVREGGRIAVVMRRKPQLLVAAFLAAWIAGWALGEWEVARRLFFVEEAPPGVAFLLVWLGLWTGAGLVTFAALLRSLGGSEVLVVRGGAVTLRRRPFGLRRTFSLPDVRALRAEPGSRTRATLAFDVGGRAVRFGVGLQAADVERVLQVLATRLPRGRSELTPEPPEPP
jgi:hypothetical protein